MHPTDGKRIVLISRRFWPLCDEAEMVVGRLAEGFLKHGAAPQVLTARWDKLWPEQVVHRGVPVHRLQNSSSFRWGTLRYIRSVSTWLRTHADEIDVVYVSLLRYDAYAAIGALAGCNVPVVLRMPGGGPTGDCHWQHAVHFGRRIQRRCKTADAIVVATRQAADELRDAGYDPDRIHWLPDGVDVEPERRLSERYAARESLAKVNYDLAIADRAPLVVAIGRLEKSRGIFDLLKAWRPAASRRPQARLWLIGDGPERERLYERISDVGLRDQVFLPGAFDSLSDIFLAADLFVAPNPQDGPSAALLKAMASGVPVVAADTPTHRELIRHNDNGLLFPPGDFRELSRIIHELLESPSHANQLAENAKRHVMKWFPSDCTVARHLELFDRLRAQPRPG